MKVFPGQCGYESIYEYLASSMLLYKERVLRWKARDALRQKKTERAISGHLIQKKQARNIKGGKKTKDHTKKRFPSDTKKNNPSDVNCVPIELK